MDTSLHLLFVYIAADDGDGFQPMLIGYGTLAEYGP